MYQVAPVFPISLIIKYTCIFKTHFVENAKSGHTIFVQQPINFFFFHASNPCELFGI